MINHIRTLLLNRMDTVAGLVSGQPGSEYIDPTFRQVNLPAQFKQLYDVLFPDGATLYQRNYTLASVMRILHAPDMEAYTLSLDPRYTYTFSEDYMASIREAAVSITSWKSTSSNTTLGYDFFDTRRWTQGSTILDWVVRHEETDGNAISVQLESRRENRIALTFSRGRSQSIPLVPDYLNIYIQDPDNALSSRFRFDIRYQPAAPSNVHRLLADLEALDARNGLAALVFADWPEYSSLISALRNLWQHADEANVRLGALLLGYALKCEQLRLGIPLLVSSSTLRRYS